MNLENNFELADKKSQVFEFICAIFPHYEPSVLEQIINEKLSTIIPEIKTSPDSNCFDFDQELLILRVEEEVNQLYNQSYQGNNSIIAFDSTNGKVMDNRALTKIISRKNSPILIEKTNPKTRSKKNAKSTALTRGLQNIPGFNFSEYDFDQIELNFLIQAFPFVSEQKLSYLYHSNNCDVDLVSEIILDGSSASKTQMPKEKHKYSAVASFSVGKGNRSIKLDHQENQTSLAPKPKSELQLNKEKENLNLNYNNRKHLPLLAKKTKRVPINKTELDKMVAQLSQLFDDVKPKKIKDICSKSRTLDEAANRVLVFKQNQVSRLRDSQDGQRFDSQDGTKQKKTNWVKLSPSISFVNSESSNSKVAVKDNTDIGLLMKYKDIFNENRVFTSEDFEISATSLKSELASEAKQFVLENGIYNSKWKDIVGYLLSKRNLCYEKATDSFKKRKNAGMNSGISVFYSEQGRSFDLQLKIWRMREAYGLVELAKNRAQDPNFVDLHSLYLEESVHIARNELKNWYGTETEGVPKPRSVLKIVTGLGSHSKGGKSILNQVIGRILSAEGWKYMSDDGIFFISGQERRVMLKK
ncbi:hypothetical protein BB560_003659 [Smittium megazygosporum]|uniref:Smr domain-containing protein n=1 Tax=Smittium megazygosporum TaxID=133381 RepID=A0A2T9ZBG6_9FUNG|nr:hypothetical protein BB560_003659 [Smittium megazygosporum]